MTMDVDLFHDLTIRVSLDGVTPGVTFLFVFNYIVARRALTSIFLIFIRTHLSALCYRATGIVIRLENYFPVVSTCPMWRLLVTLQSFPASKGRFYLVSLISKLVCPATR